MHIYRNVCVCDTYGVEERLYTRPLSGVWEDIAPMLMFCLQKTKVTEIEFKLVSKTTFWKDLGLVFEELLVII